MRTFSILSALFLALCFPARADRLAEALTPDPAVRTGKLANGLTWYIRKNAKPEKRVELRLVVRAGSTLEDDDQRGLAHLLEHMAFNGSEHFGKQDVVNFLEGLGVAFGPHLNAYTSFDQTVYLLQLPTHEQKNIEKGIVILEDWAHGLKLEDEEINKERGVVQEEWRRGRGADERIRDVQFPVLFHGSKYAERLPIGVMDVIAKFPARRVRDFYHDWYRPDLMSVIVVGDIDPDAIQKMIETHFNDHKMPDKPREHVLFPVPPHEETLAAIVDDPEATETSVALYHKMPPEDLRTVGDYRRRMVAQLVAEMLNQRFDEISRRPDAPFLGAYAWKGSFVRGVEFFGMGARVAEGAAAAALKGIAEEAERARRHGFTTNELERVKKMRMREVRSQWRERDSQESGELAAGLVDVITDESVDPGIDAELKLYEEFLPGITLDEVNTSVGRWIHPTNRVVMADGPRKPGVELPAKEQALAMLGDIGKADLAAWKDDAAGRELMKRPEQPGTVVKREEIKELGITIATLSNGVVLWLKPTDFKKDQVLLTAFSKGGLSMSREEDFVSASNATEVVELSGLGDMDAVTLQKALAGRMAAVRPVIGPYFEGLQGGGSPEDLETLFQLAHLHFTSPRKDDQAVQTLVRNLKAGLENRMSSPDAWLEDRTAQILFHNHPMYRALRADELSALNRDAALEFYRQRFADADDFTFILVGNFDVNAVLDLACAYLATLPKVEGRETWRDPGIRMPARRMTHIVEKGIEPRARVRMVYTGPLPDWNPVLRNRLQSLAAGLSIRLREVIREELGGSYDIDAGADFEQEPALEYRFFIEFGCAPERVDELLAGVRKLVADAREDDLPREVLAKVRETQIRRREAAMKTNEFWAFFLQYSLQVGQDPKITLDYEKMVKSLTGKELRKLAAALLTDDRETVLILRPENPVK
ncbi:MAG: insulinase family protein [Kiritimatiellia bacterium]